MFLADNSQVCRLIVIRISVFMVDFQSPHLVPSAICATDVPPSAYYCLPLIGC